VANEFINHYQKVYLFTGNFREGSRPLSKDVKIIKTVEYKRDTLIKRVYSWILCSFHLFFILLFKYRRAEILYYSNPPIACWCSLILPNKFSVVVFDTYPDFLGVMGISENSLIYRVWGFINKKVYRKATGLITLTESMKLQLEKYIDSSKIKVVSVWPSTNDFTPINRDENPFILKNNYQEKKLIVYSGNIGLGQNLDVLINIADSLRNFENIKIVIIGEGARKEGLIKSVNLLKLKNVDFFTWQKAAEMKYSLGAADISVVSLSKDASHVSIPSKTFNLLVVGAPILCFAPKNSELGILISKNDVGEVFEPGSWEEASSFIPLLLNDSKKLEKFRFNIHRLATEFSFKLSK
jgi:hypothetical protein